MSRDISVKKGKKIDLGDKVWVEVRRLWWGEVEDINAECRDSKSGKIDDRKRSTLTITKAITGFGGFTEGAKKLTHPHDLEKMIGGLYYEEATKVFLEAIADHAEAEGELGN
jgi:hypothetical protein